MSNFNKLLENYRKISFSERDKGNRFERLMQAFLKTDPKYAYRFKKVWLWNEFPGKNDLGGTDTGIDLVALTHEGDYWAIQCKCFDEEAVIDKPALDSFLSTSSRGFKNEELKTTHFSNRLWISTTNHWGVNAEEAIKTQHPPVTRVNLYDLQESPVDWEKLEKGITGEVARAKKNKLFPHQKEALENTHQYFKKKDRGKLIMACGTGKTFTSLRIAENETKGKGLILFLVPSISLLGQILREWTAQAEEPIKAICICSDPEVSRKKTKEDDSDNFSVVDLALPASTNVKQIVAQLKQARSDKKKGMTVVFSTYQSIDVISKAQKELLKTEKDYGTFDLIICDEAHRTTGVALTSEDSSAFIKVHDNNFIKAKKRLYMTATPRLYSDDAKGKAAQADVILCSMDDVSLYGEEIYRIGFGKAVEDGLLTDYKVLVFTLSDKDIPPAVQNIISDKKSEINTDDASKIIGSINALSKQMLIDSEIIKSSDPEPMKRAVAFCSSIAVSKKITSTFNTATSAYISSLPLEKKEQMVSVSSLHIDGTMSAPSRDEKLGWLKADGDSNECRILTNVRCLSEGVDVPSLDAVLFLSARNSQVDVVQSVGRVMRKADGKKYGYIIIPIVVPSDVEADKALDDNDRYRVVWTVLNALRAHDDRFNATVNKIELNKKRPDQILIGRPEYSFDEHGLPIAAEPGVDYGNSEIGHQLAIQFEQLQAVIFARMVQKVGSKPYWEQWAKDVAGIAERQVERINGLIKKKGEHKKAFEDFLSGLRKNINPSITEQEAVEMLSQHIITKPVFEALFEGYSFVKSNAISLSMQKMLDLLEAQAMEKDAVTLDKFYESVKQRAKDIDNSKGKQKIIVELYDKFFKTAFPKMVEKLGIVYTPVEVVDFIVHSVNDVLQKEFGRTISDENIHILDPFTGTGTFITRLLQSGLINKKDLGRKYQNEIFANEIVLLAYYIAAVNIENAYHDITEENKYSAFEGICLTDTFQLGETDGSEKLFSKMFPQNSERVAKQMKAPLRVIIGNPPYSVGQKSANDNAANQKYLKLDNRISETYVKDSVATNSASSYNSYIKAFRWSTDRISDSKGGIICFVTNGGWLDSNSQDGFRKCLENEFTSIYVVNLRGNANSSGEFRRKEGGNVFGEGTKTPITITLLVKKNKVKNDKATIFYFDIGDYLNKNEKIKALLKIGTVTNSEIGWKIIKPNEKNDWINQRNESFNTFFAMGDKDESKSKSFFIPLYSNGVKTNRDPWVYNYSRGKLIDNMKETISIYNDELKKYLIKSKGVKNAKADDYVDFSKKMISWTREIKWDIEKGKQHNFEKECIRLGMYRPFNKEYLYFSKDWNNMRYLIPKLFSKAELANKVICLPAPGGNKGFSVIISELIPDIHLNGDSQCFPLFYYEERGKQNMGLFDEDGEGDFIRRDGISDFILERGQKMYGNKVAKEDIFYYVYGFLHSPEYRNLFENDLKKMLPRIPLVDEPRDFWKFSKAGRALAELHINYESVPAYEGVKVKGAESKFFTVEKMRFPKKDEKETIYFNSKITIENIPAKAYEYIVNGKSAIEWIMESYQVSEHKESGIKNDPNDWAKEVGNPRYILDLLLSVINVSVQTVDIVNGLPKVSFETVQSENAV